MIELFNKHGCMVDFEELFYTSQTNVVLGCRRIKAELPLIVQVFDEQHRPDKDKGFH
jgi:hypothetical protein